MCVWAFLVRDSVCVRASVSRGTCAILGNTGNAAAANSRRRLVICGRRADTWLRRTLCSSPLVAPSSASALARRLQMRMLSRRDRPWGVGKEGSCVCVFVCGGGGPLLDGRRGDGSGGEREEPRLGAHNRLINGPRVTAIKVACQRSGSESQRRFSAMIEEPSFSAALSTAEHGEASLLLFIGASPSLPPPPPPLSFPRSTIDF